MEHHHQSVGWPGFSPGPLSVSMSPAPDHPSTFEFSTSRAAGAGNDDEPGSPLVFMRTPGAVVQDITCPDSSKRFNSWMESTSPYAGRKTPPTASMKSMAAGDENTPPGHDMARVPSDKQGGFGNTQHFQSWLRATHSTSWTPRKSPAAATPPPAPAPSPAATPMSIMRDLQHSAATPPSPHRVQAQGSVITRAAAAAATGEFDTSEEEEDDDGGEASTTVGAAQLAAAADRAAAASRIAGQRAAQHQQQQLSTPPRVPASSPVISGPAVLGVQQQQASLLQAAADRMAQDSLATPMSQLSISSRPGGAAASGPPASPAEKLIDLMLSPGGGSGHTRSRTHQHGHQHHHQQQQLTPSRLSAAFGPGSSTAAHAPLSPNLQVIDLMMHTDAAAAGGSDATADGDGSSSNASAAATRGMQEQQAQAVQEEAASGADEDTASDVSDRGSESDDEMDLSELQALVGEGVGPDTPLSVILGMLTGTPQVVGLTPAVGAAAQQHGGNDEVAPRVLFADD